jgi:hypothetical protein
MAERRVDLEIGEDLFDFDELLRDITQDTDELGAAFDAVLATTSPAPEEPVGASGSEPPAPLPAPTLRVRPVPPPLAPPAAVVPAPAQAPQPARPTTPAAAPASAAQPVAALPATATTTVLQRITLSPGLIAVMVLFAVLNLGLVAVVVRAFTSVQSTVVDVGHQVVQSSEAVREEASALVADHRESVLPVVSDRPEGLTAIERARAQFELGAWESGRQTLFALLAVIDRVPPEVRGNVEARARFLLADSWRLEAEALERQFAQPREGAQ